MSSEHVVHGQCKMAAGCEREHVRDCLEEADRVARATTCELTRRLDTLRREVESYVKDPGCNINSRRTKFERLRWAAEQSKA